MPNYDVYPRPSSSDPGLTDVAVGAVPAAGLVPANIVNYRVPFVAGAGTTLDIQVPFAAKCRIIDMAVKTTSTVASAVAQVFTAASGGGTACTSSVTCAAPGVTRDALTTATQVFQPGTVAYLHFSGGATLPGGEANITVQLEQ